MTASFRTTVALCLIGVATHAYGDNLNWPQWRGPEGTGKTTADNAVTHWGPEQNVKWRVGLPEAGNSTPVVWEDQVFFTQPMTDARQRALFCVDRATGREIWRRAVTYDQAEASHKTNPFCSATPVTDGERVIAWFGSAGLLCWDLEGNELWRRDLGAQEHMWGYGTSPILLDGLCILLFGPGNHEFLLAVDKTTGETRWEVGSLDDTAERELSGAENDGGSDDFDSDKPRSERLRGAWNTPIVINVDGHDELVAALPRRVCGFDPVNGKLLWTCGGAAPLAYASPVESNGVIVALGGYGGASLAVRGGGRGDVTETHRLWHKPNDSGWLGTGIGENGLIYACDMGGVLSCLDASTGDEQWKDRIDGGGTWSSITQSGDGRMFLLTKSGATTVFKPGPDNIGQLAENRLDEASNASVVIAGNDVLIRTDKALWCFADSSHTDEPTQ